MDKTGSAFFLDISGRKEMFTLLNWMESLKFSELVVFIKERNITRAHYPTLPRVGKGIRILLSI